MLGEQSGKYSYHERLLTANSSLWSMSKANIGSACVNEPAIKKIVPEHSKRAVAHAALTQQIGQSKDWQSRNILTAELTRPCSESQWSHFMMPAM
jgi:hypothetical protein